MDMLKELLAKNNELNNNIKLIQQEIEENTVDISTIKLAMSMEIPARITLGSISGRVVDVVYENGFKICVPIDASSSIYYGYTESKFHVIDNSDYRLVPISKKEAIEYDGIVFATSKQLTKDDPSYGPGSDIGIVFYYGVIIGEQMLHLDYDGKLIAKKDDARYHYKIIKKV